MGITLEIKEVQQQGDQGIVVTDVEVFKNMINILERLFGLTLPLNARDGLRLVLSDGMISFEHAEKNDLLDAGHSTSTAAMFDGLFRLIDSSNTYLDRQRCGDDNGAFIIDHNNEGRTVKCLELLKRLPDPLSLRLGDEKTMALVPPEGFIKSDKATGTECLWSHCRINKPDLDNFIATFFNTDDKVKQSAEISMSAEDFDTIREFFGRDQRCDVTFKVTKTISSRKFKGELLSVISSEDPQHYLF